MQRRNSGPARRRQRGMALIALLAVIMLGSAWMITTRLNEGSTSFTTQQRTHNAEVLNRAKLALIGYAAQQALADSNPGRLPCPEAASVIGTTSDGSVPTGSEGTSPTGSFTCASVGRLPWRTLGLDKLVDSAGEPLWYVVGATWRLTDQTSSLNINSNTTGDVQVDGQRVVALIIAPGAAMDAKVATGCTARTQARSAPAATMSALDYIECLNLATLAYTTTAGSTTINDQFVKITTDDVMQAVEPMIAKRIENEVVGVLNTVYAAGTTWGNTAGPAYAFPATFSDPSAASFQGNSGISQGLLPFNYHSSSCGGNARCSTDAITWNASNAGAPTFATSGGPGYLPSSPTCDYSTASKVCYGYYYGGTMDVKFTDNASDITKGLRTFNTANHTGSYYAWYWNGSTWVSIVSAASATTSRALLADASANFVTSATLPSISAWGYFYLFHNRPSDASFGDHAILSASHATTGWFVRNEWYRLLYYAIAPGHRPGQAYSCATGSTCLTVTNMTDGTQQQAILILAGRSLSTLSQARPSSSLQNYLDGNVDTTNNNMSAYVQSTVGRSFNDRFISLAKNPS